MNDVPKYYPQWATCYAMLGDDFSCVSVDLGYLRMLPVSGKRNTFRVTIALQTPNEVGLPDNDEKANLDKIGHALNESINSKIDASYVGFIASNQDAGFYFCMESNSIQKQAIDNVICQFPGYMGEVFMIEEDNWSIYTACLYPAHQHYEMIKHSAVVTRLEKGGDPLTKPRQVDHWIYFRDVSDRVRFIEKVREEGFQIDNCSEDFQDEEWPYCLQISRTDMVDRQSLFKYTSYLWNLAYEHYGNYDGWGTLEEKE